MNTKPSSSSVAELKAQLESQDRELAELTKLAEDLPADAVFPNTVLTEIEELTEPPRMTVPSNAPALPLFSIRV